VIAFMHCRGDFTSFEFHHVSRIVTFDDSHAHGTFVVTRFDGDCFTFSALLGAEPVIVSFQRA
jgi:hypothetical protein